MKKVVTFWMVLLLVTLNFSQVIVKEVSTKFPEMLYKQVGTRTLNFQYIELFADTDLVGMIVKGWYFVGTQKIDSKKFEVKVVSERETSYYFDGKRQGSYIYLNPVLIVCPANSKILIDNVEFYKPKKTVLPVEGDEKMVGAYIVASVIQNGRYVEREAVTTQDHVYIKIVAGTFPTGGYSIQTNEPEIVFPVGNNKGKIVITGYFKTPGKGEMVTQAFTTPTAYVEIGRLPKGDYEVIANIENLGTFRFVLKVE